jgi:hypothetical protein
MRKNRAKPQAASSGLHSYSTYSAKNILPRSTAEITRQKYTNKKAS